MTPTEYTKLACRTEYPTYAPMRKRLEDKKLFRLTHAGIGMCTEAGEFNDMLKRVLYYGKEMDDVNLAEEIGDMLWYCAVACDALGISMEEIMETNIAKLKARFPIAFTEDKALNRDLDTERAVLEGSKINLCNTCIKNPPTCDGVHMRYGDNPGNDNVIACNFHDDGTREG